MSKHLVLFMRFRVAGFLALLTVAGPGASTGCDPERKTDPKHHDTDTGGETDTGETEDTTDTDKTDDTVDTKDSDTDDTDDTEDTEDTGGPLYLDYRESAWATVYSAEPYQAVGIPYALGDLSGDGIEDLCFQGEVPDTCYGFNSPLEAGEHELSEADFVIDLVSVKGWYYVSAPGDLNGDGLADLSVAAWILFGPVEGEVTPENADLMIEYDPDSYYPISGQVGRGDATADARQDLLLGFYHPVPDTHSDSFIMVYDEIDGAPIHMDDSANAIRVHDFMAEYSALETFGYAGDLNADGYDDIYYTDYGGHLILAPVTGIVDDEGFLLPGDAQAPAGDANGDGYDDIMGVRTGSHGEVYLLLGPIGRDMVADDAYAVIDIGGENSTNWPVTNTGDLSRDGLPDVVISLWEGATERSSAHIYYSPFEGTQDRSDSDIIIQSSRIWGVETAGPIDVDGDELTDLLFGDTRHDVYSANGGASWVILGGSF